MMSNNIYAALLLHCKTRNLTWLYNLDQSEKAGKGEHLMRTSPHLGDGAWLRKAVAFSRSLTLYISPSCRQCEGRRALLNSLNSSKACINA